MVTFFKVTGFVRRDHLQPVCDAHPGIYILEQVSATVAVYGTPTPEWKMWTEVVYAIKQAYHDQGWTDVDIKEVQ